jgi:hypothetical protein
MINVFRCSNYIRGFELAITLEGSPPPVCPNKCNELKACTTAFRNWPFVTAMWKGMDSAHLRLVSLSFYVFFGMLLQFLFKTVFSFCYGLCCHQSRRLYYFFPCNNQFHLGASRYCDHVYRICQYLKQEIQRIAKQLTLHEMILLHLVDIPLRPVGKVMQWQSWAKSRVSRVLRSAFWMCLWSFESSRNQYSERETQSI